MKKFYTLAAMLVAAASFGFSANAQDEPVTVEDYKSDMTDWTFERAGGSRNWQKLSTNGYFADDRLTESEQAACGCEDGICIEYDDDNDTNAWAISPAVELKGGVDYTITIYLKGVGGGENLRIMAAEGNTVADLSAGTQCFDVKGFSTSSLTKRTGSFKPAGDGEYHFGVNCYSEAENYGLIASGFSVSHEQTSGVEAVITDSEAKAEYFDLQGRRVEEPKAGLYICRKGNTVTKAVVK